MNSGPTHALEEGCMSVDFFEQEVPNWLALHIVLFPSVELSVMVKF